MMEWMMKKRIIDNETIEFTFDDLESIRFDCRKMSEANRAYARVHGMVQRLGDTAAGAKTESARREAVAALAAHYESGSDSWDVARGARVAQENPAVRAYADKLGISYADALVRIAQAALDALAA